MTDDAASGSGSWALKWLSKGEDPHKSITALIDVTVLLCGYCFLYVYQSHLGLEVPLLSIKALIATPLVGLILLPLIHYLFVEPDPLQRSPSSNREIRFFQNEFPSRYLLQRCEKCAEKESCKKSLSVSSGALVRIWFNEIFHGAIERENPKIVTSTFEKSYTCKLVFYMKRTLLMFLGLAILTIIVHHLIMWRQSALKLDFDVWQILFPVATLLIWTLIHMLHSADHERPSGCWHAWREINRIHVSWMEDHESEIIDLVCRRAGGTKTFRIS